jgi:hypothetical protein
MSVHHSLSSKRRERQAALRCACGYDQPAAGPGPTAHGQRGTEGRSAGPGTLGTRGSAMNDHAAEAKDFVPAKDCAGKCMMHLQALP